VPRATVTAQLHAALREYPAELPFLMPLNAWIPDALAQLERSGELFDKGLLSVADLDRARREWAVLEPLACSQAAFEVAFPGVDVQPIHGDAPHYNIIVTPEGELCSDFEHATLGAGSAMIVDAHVVALAVESGGGVVVTGDEDDLGMLSAPYRHIMVEPV